MSDSIVIIPTYNEKENIENIIRAVFGLEKVFHILVIDDGSPDGTAAIRRLYRAGCRRSHRVEVLQRGECGELAVGPCVDVLFRLGVCPYRHGYEDTGYDGGF